jgi:hypothetical protein
MKKVFVLVILALVAGGVFAQTDNSTFLYSEANFQGREEKWTGILAKGTRYIIDLYGFKSPLSDGEYTRDVVQVSDGVYKYYDCYVVGSFGDKDGDPAQNGPLYYYLNNTSTLIRRYAEFNDDRGIRCIDRRSGRYPRYAVKQIQTGPNQTVAIMTSQATDLLHWSEKVGLLLIQPNSRVEFNSEGLILHSGRITEDANIRKASKLDEVMSIYSQVMDHPDLYGMNMAYASAILNVGNDPDDIAKAIIGGYARGQFGFSLTAGIVMPIWMLPAELANAFGSNLLKASLAYAISMAYGTKPESSDEFKYDLYILLAGEDVDAVLKSAAKAAGVSIGTELLSKEFILEKLATAGKLGLNAASSRSARLAGFQTAIMNTNVAKTLAKKLSLKGIAKAVPIISAAIFSVKDAVDVVSFGNEAKRYYTNKAAEGVEGLPENVDVVFQTASVSATSKDGFFVPSSSNPQNNTGIQLGNIGSDNSTHRIFQLQHIGDGWYRIKNNKFGVLTVPGSKNENDVQMVLSPQGNNNPTNQQFKITKVGTGLYKIWTYYGRVIRVRDGLVRKNHIVTWAESRFSANSQTWRIYTVDAQGELTQSGERSGGGHVFSGPPAPARITGPTNWTAVRDSTFGTTTIRGVAYGNNTWVAVGEGGKIAYSTNGTSWTAVTDAIRGVPTTFSSVAFGNNMFIVVGNGIDFFSTDNGKTWERLEGIPTNPDQAIAYSGNRWVAVGRGRTAYSTDGTNWITVDAANVFDTSFINGLAFGNNRWVTGGGRSMAYSTNNGESWTPVQNANNPFFSGGGAVSGIAYGGNRFVAVANGSRIAFSSDGASWTEVARSNIPLEPIGITFGKDRFVTVGVDGKIAYSADGTSWTAVPNSTLWNYTNSSGAQRTATIRAIAYANGRFVAVGEGGKMAWADW